MNDPVLCYVDGHFAYFTTKPLAEQWGDDWNDAPYEHNAGLPYGPYRGYKYFNRETGEWVEGSDFNEDGSPKWAISEVAWSGPLNTPANLATGGNSRWSVDMINAGMTPWLCTDQYTEPKVAIFAGVTVPEFIQKVQQAGGTVYVPVAAGAAEAGE